MYVAAPIVKFSCLTQVVYYYFISIYEFVDKGLRPTKSTNIDLPDMHPFLLSTCFQNYKTMILITQFDMFFWLFEI